MAFAFRSRRRFLIADDEADSNSRHSFRLGAPSSNLPRIFPTWGPKFKSSADLSNLGPQVQIFRGSFQLGAPCSNLPRIFSTWGPKFKSSADLFNLGPQVRIFRRSF